MTARLWISEWYRGVPTEDLVHMFEEATERAEFTPDKEEKEHWKERMEGMEEELLRRQDLQEQIEL
jgi:hypothetical protein